MSIDKLSPEYQAAVRLGVVTEADAMRDQHGEKREPKPAERPTDTDIANARRFVLQHGDSVRFTPERGWLAWDGKRWQADDLGRIRTLAKDTAEAIFDEIRFAAKQDEVFRWAKKSQGARAIRDMLYLAEVDPAVTARLADFDADPMLLNCANGALDLRTGALRIHERKDLITRMVPVEYDPDAQAPRWLAFLERIMHGDDELQAFLQRAAGYSLTASVQEQVLFFCFGGGQNGKSVYLETMQRLLGDYSMNARTETITARMSPGIPNDIARLAGARFVAINETADGQKLHEPLIKDLTGGDTVTARFLHREYFDFRPIFKLWLRGNHKPTITGTDLGIWRRIRLIPFTVRIPESERDPRLADKMVDELPGILAWAVRGCLDWQRHGLSMPAAVADAVREYRTEMDVLGAFLEDRCMVRANAQVTAKALYGAYRRWAEESGESAVNQMRFGLAMVERGFRKERTRSGVIYSGLELPMPTDSRGDL